jgi:hypothetical protein
VGVVRRLSRKLRPVFGAGDDHDIILLTGSGTAAMEMAISSLVPPGKQILTVENGAFGERLGEIADLHGVARAVVRLPWGAPPEPATIEAALDQNPDIAALAMVHHETSVGVLNPVAGQVIVNLGWWRDSLGPRRGSEPAAAGDTAIGPHFDMIGARFPPFDAVILPIGAYSPRWFMRDRHIDPPEAVAAARILRASCLLPIHWGTFKLSDEPLGEPPLYLRRIAETAGQKVRVWMPGDVHDV